MPPLTCLSRLAPAMAGKRDLVTRAAMKPHDGRPARIVGVLRGDDFPCVDTGLRSRGITTVELDLDTLIGHHRAIDSDGRGRSSILIQCALLIRGVLRRRCQIGPSNPRVAFLVRYRLTCPGKWIDIMARLKLREQPRSDATRSTLATTRNIRRNGVCG